MSQKYHLEVIEQLIQSGQHGYRITLWLFIQEKQVYVRCPDHTVLKNRQLWYSSWLTETLASTKPGISMLVADQAISTFGDNTATPDSHARAL